MSGGEPLTVELDVTVTVPGWLAEVLSVIPESERELFVLRYARFALEHAGLAASIEVIRPPQVPAGTKPPAKREWATEDTIANITHVGWLYPDGVHTREELRQLEPGRRNYDAPCKCRDCKAAAGKDN